MNETHKSNICSAIFAKPLYNCYQPIICIDI